MRRSLFEQPPAGSRLQRGSLEELGRSLDEIEKSVAGEDSAGEFQSSNFGPGGNFGIQVLELALQRFSLDLSSATSPEGRRRMADPAQEGRAFICNRRNHWYTIRQVSQLWWDLESRLPTPRLMQANHVAARLKKLVSEGYSIFFVQGKELPEPSKQQGDGPDTVSFHQISDLLREPQPETRVCRFYAKGCCRDGDACKFRHEKASPEGAMKRTNSAPSLAAEVDMPTLAVNMDLANEEVTSGNVSVAATVGGFAKWKKARTADASLSES